VDIRLLGPVQVWRERTQVDVGPRQQRFVLAVLAMEINRVVTVDRLVDLCWPGCPPSTARHAIRVNVSRLRAVLATNELARERGGYLLRADPMLVDAHRFRALTEQARRTARDADRVCLFRRALSLWRGPALADVATPEVVDRLTCGLTENRLAAAEECLESELRLGRHRAVLDELAELAAQHPYRQGLVALLMTAQYRSGRAGDALLTFRNARALLARDLGLDPEGRLLRLEEAILRADPTLDWRGYGVARVSPAQLPAGIADFAGRADKLAHLAGLVPERPAAGPVLVAITGPAGVGKTALAVHFAHRIADRFADGQLYVDLGGFTADEPTAPVAILGRMLRGLGMSRPDIPRDPDVASAMYRSLLAGKRILVLLDDAASAEQARPLLPGSAGCLALVTSRCRLAGLAVRNGAHRIAIGGLAPDDAAELVAGVVGPERAAAERDAVRELTRLCGYLPLALRVAATGIASRAQDPIARTVAALRGPDRLAALRAEGDPQAGVAAALDRTYRVVPPPARRLFERLCLAPEAEVGAAAAAALGGLTVEAARANLARLAEVHLIEQPGDDRFSVSELVRLYGAERARRAPRAQVPGTRRTTR
jgi:DNA-binding SARP family transcriptional activator